MTTVDERRTAAVVGALVADAAVQPLHWIYNEEKLNNLIKDKEEIEFWEPSANPFYSLERGRFSCYGDQSYVILKSLVDCNGLNVDRLKTATYKFFGPNSDYDSEINSSYAGTKEKKVLGKNLPISGPWRHASIKHFLKNYEEGREETGSETDEQIDCILRIVPVVALYAGQPDMLDKVKDVIRVTQNFETTEVIGLAAARILELYILEGKCPDSVERVIGQLQDPDRQNPDDLDLAVIGFLRDVLAQADQPHKKTVKEFFRKD